MPSASRQTVYRKPGAQLTVEQVAVKLREMERSFVTRWSALLSLGAIVTMFGPVVIGSIVWVSQFGSRRGGPPVVVRSWLAEVGITALIMLPIVFALEWVTRGKLVDNTVESIGDYGGSFRYIPGAGRGVAGLMFIEMCLWGPRMVIAGSKKIAGQSKHAAADRNVAAAIVHAFVLSDSGLNVGQLFPLANNRDDVFSDVLAYLLFFDVIGLSKNGDRAWLLSDAQRALKLKMT